MSRSSHPARAVPALPGDTLVPAGLTESERAVQFPFSAHGRYSPPLEDGIPRRPVEETYAMKTTAAALGIAIALGLGAATTAEAGDRHGRWGDRGYSAQHYDRDHHKGAKHYRHGKKRGIHRGHRYGAHKRVYRGKGRHYWKRDHWKSGGHRGYRDHGYRHYRPYGGLYKRRHHSYRSGIGLNIDGVTFIWSERHYR
jgi:hypothetical protein